MMEKQYYAIFNRFTHKFRGIDYCYPHEQGSLPKEGLPLAELPEVIAIPVQDELIPEKGIKLKTKYSFTYVDHNTVSVVLSPDYSQFSKLSFTEIQKNVLASLKEGSVLSQSLKDNLIASVQAELADFLAEGFCWIGADEQVKFYEATPINGIIQICRKSLREKSKDLKQQPEKVIVSQDGHDCTEMEEKEFNIFVLSLAEYLSRLQPAAAMINKSILECKTISDLAKVQAPDFVTVVENIPVTYTKNKGFFARTLGKFQQAIVIRRINKQKQKLAEIEMMTLSQLMALSLSKLTFLQRQAAEKRIAELQ